MAHGNVKDGSISVSQEGGWKQLLSRGPRKKYAHLRYLQQTPKLPMYFSHQLPARRRSGEHTSRSVGEKKTEIGQCATEHGASDGSVLCYKASGTSQ